jgi:hypothetical protein
LQETMLRLCGGKSQNCTNVVRFKESIVPQDLLLGGPGRQKVQDIADSHPETTDAGAPAALPGFDGDPFQKVLILHALASSTMIIPRGLYWHARIA